MVIIWLQIVVVAQGTKTVENVFENEPLDVDKYYKDKEERIHKLGSVVSCSSESEELSHSPTDILDSACSFPGDVSRTRKGRKPGGCPNDNNHLQSFQSQVLANVSIHFICLLCLWTGR